MLKLNGFYRMCENGKGSLKEVFDWGDALADSGILAGLSFFTTMGATHLVGVPTLEAVLAGAIAGSIEFFTLMAIKRGLKEKRAS